MVAKVCFALRRTRHCGGPVRAGWGRGRLEVLPASGPL